jgi:hypothetical protein
MCGEYIHVSKSLYGAAQLSAEFDAKEEKYNQHNVKVYIDTDDGLIFYKE